MEVEQTRPSFLRRQSRCQVTMAALCLVLIAPSSALAERCAKPGAVGQLVYIGSQTSEPGQGIVGARLEPRTGRLTPLGVAAEAVRPTWLTPHPTLPVLYSVSEVGNDGKSQGSVLTFRADPTSGLLRGVGAVASGGGGPTHLAMDLRGRTVAAANYGTGQVATFPILADAVLGSAASVQTHQGSGPSPRQKSAHAHGVAFDPSGRFLLSADLGADRLFVHRYDETSRALSNAPMPSQALPAGSGPRHLAFHPRGRFLYLLTELVPELRAYRWDAKQGRLHLVQTASTAADPGKPGAAKGAEVATSRDGRFVYVSVRGDDALIAYGVNRRTGELREIQRLPASGQSPWSFGIDPTGRWMLVTNQASNAVAVFSRDRATGRLTPTAAALTVNKPVSVAYLNGAACR